MTKNKTPSPELVSNRKARFDYEILETFEAGMVLKGTEIKSLRDHGGSLQESYIKVYKGVPTLIGSSIAPYRYGNVHNHEDRRDRVLLMHKREIEKLRIAQEQKGLAIVPLAIVLRKGYAKLVLAIGRGKKLHDKRQAIKERESKRSMQRLDNAG